MRLLLGRLANRAIRMHGVRNLTTEITDSMSTAERSRALRAHMDFLPGPAGKWQEINAQKQTKYNMHLLLSTIVFGVASYFFMTMDVWYEGSTSKPLNIEEYYHPTFDLRTPYYLEVIEKGTEVDEEE